MTRHVRWYALISITTLLYGIGCAPTKQTKPDQSDVDRRNGGTGRRLDDEAPERCGTQHPSGLGTLLLEDQQRHHMAQRPSTLSERNPGAITIRVQFHVITRGPAVSDGNIPISALDEQIDALNRAYSGQLGAGAANTPFRFTRAGVTVT